MRYITTRKASEISRDISHATSMISDLSSMLSTAECGNAHQFSMRYQREYGDFISR